MFKPRYDIVITASSELNTGVYLVDHIILYTISGLNTLLINISLLVA